MPSEQREALVAEVERRVVASHGRTPIAAREAEAALPMVHIRGTPSQRGGVLEEVEMSYAAVRTDPARKGAKRRRA